MNEWMSAIGEWANRDANAQAVAGAPSELNGANPPRCHSIPIDFNNSFVNECFHPVQPQVIGDARKGIINNRAKCYRLRRRLMIILYSFLIEWNAVWMRQTQDWCFATFGRRMWRKMGEPKLNKELKRCRLFFFYSSFLSLYFPRSLYIYI